MNLDKAAFQNSFYIAEILYMLTKTKNNQSTELLTRVDFIDYYLFSYQHMLFHIASSFLARLNNYSHCFLI